MEVELLDSLLVLFNPWSKDHGVYMENSNFLNNYILNEEGNILGGTFSKKRLIPWHYSQPSLIPAMKLFLSWLPLTPEQRADPVLMAREVTSMVNNNGQNNSVLVGRWDGNYGDYRASDGHLIKANRPSYWDGSAEILERFLSDPKNPVLYGQCWVFAGLSNTIFRFLGILSRAVTAYDSDDDNMPFDLYLSQYIPNAKVKHKRMIEEIQWNFHVWNEIWMKRPDLGTNKYDGWQATDATPQVLINKIHNVGPVPVKAILNADLNLKKYWEDAIFVYAEVNADVKLYDSNGFLRFIDKT
ncbi:Hemocyte protein-glutamine gamma-glutamyltransferase-like protein, partial [Dinothrombium tinctorium]